MVKQFKTMPKGCVIVPVHNNPARCSVYDPSEDCYVKGAINITRVNAEMRGASCHPKNWKEVAKANGWGPLQQATSMDSDESEIDSSTDDPAGLVDSGTGELDEEAK